MGSSPNENSYYNVFKVLSCQNNNNNNVSVLLPFFFLSSHCLSI